MCPPPMLYISLCLHTLCPSFLFLSFHLLISHHTSLALSSRPSVQSAVYNLSFLYLFLSPSPQFTITLFYFRLCPHFLCLLFLLTPSLSHSFSRSEVSSWRVVVLTVFIFVRINMTPPVCQLSHPAAWPGFHRYVFVLKTTTYCCLHRSLFPVCLTFRFVETWTDRLYIFVVLQI